LETGRPRQVAWCGTLRLLGRTMVGEGTRGLLVIPRVVRRVVEGDEGPAELSVAAGS